MWVRSLGWEDPLEEGVATHPSILVWRIPWNEGWVLLVPGLVEYDLNESHHLTHLSNKVWCSVLSDSSWPHGL